MWRDRRGQLLIPFALIMPVLLVVVGAAAEIGWAMSVRQKLQAHADAAALAAAKLIDLATVDEHGRPLSPQAAAEAEVGRFLTAHGRDDVTATVLVTGAAPPHEVMVTLASEPQPLLPVSLAGHVVAMEARASAEVANAGPICLFALADGAGAGLTFGGSARIEAPTCGVQVNAGGNAAFTVTGSGALTAELVSIAGGYAPGAASVSPLPQTGAPRLRDPLSDKTDWPATSGSCDFTGISISAGAQTLLPGLYCGGLTISGTAEVTFEPGVYVIKGARLQISSNARVFGEGVAFFLADAKTWLQVKDSSYIELSPPTSGPMEGILIAQDPRLATGATRHQLGERGQSRYSGLFYFPKSKLQLNMGHAPDFTPDTLIFIADTIVVGNRETFRLRAQGQAGYVTTAARLTD